MKRQKQKQKIIKRIDMVGFEHGRLKVLKYSHSHAGRCYWKVKCECENKFIADGNRLRSRKHYKVCLECGERFFLNA